MIPFWEHNTVIFADCIIISEFLGLDRSTRDGKS
jgi:hypothetical protein